MEFILNNHTWLIWALVAFGYVGYILLTFFVKVPNKVEPEKLVEAYFLIDFAKKRDARYRESIREKRA